MSHSRLIAGIVGIGFTTAISGIAGAADLPNRKSIAPVAFAPTTAASWTGVYLGVQAGVGMSAAEVKFPAGIGGVDGAMGRGLLGGLRIGADYQLTPNLVVGLIGTADFGDIGGKVRLGSGTFSMAGLRVDSNTFSSNKRPVTETGTGTLVADGGADVKTTDLIGVRARIGYLVTPDTLLFVAPGWASAKGTMKARLGSTVATDNEGNTESATYNDAGRFSKRVNGFQVGVGFESRLTDNLSANFEYVYSKFADYRIGNSPVKVAATTGTFVAGINYRFGVNAGAAPQRSAPTRENWGGLYAGISGAAGIGGAKARVGSILTLDSLGSTGISGGVVVGYDYQVAPRWVIGAELGGDLSSFDVSARLEPGYGDVASFKTSMPWALTAKARAGYLITPGTMLFASLGVTGGQFKIKADLNGYGIKESSSSYGAMVGLGGGFETAMSKNVFLRMEYQHAMLPAIKLKSISSAPVKMEPTAGTARVSLIYKM